MRRFVDRDQVHSCTLNDVEYKLLPLSIGDRKRLSALQMAIAKPLREAFESLKEQGMTSEDEGFGTAFSKAYTNSDYKTMFTEDAEERLLAIFDKYIQEVTHPNKWDKAKWLRNLDDIDIASLVAELINISTLSEEDEKNSDASSSSE